ncbi:hypothetical protein LWI29_012545 [Acer saccharum]|uniref:non-specific serine/threonine protein kinase n=1 Tax=Acer saccharum TaxID=4024 RepID=A0AA39SUY9_ACESA|nr:hypothetical protein LWI29_012545 [Acer saccharum]
MRMMMMLRPPPPPFLLLLFTFFWVCLVHVAQAQNQPTTDLNEVRALDSIFKRWGLYYNSSNIRGWPCCGIAADTNTSDSDAFSGRNVPHPTIKCVCTYNNSTLCHITQFSIGTNALSGELPKELGKMTDMRSFAIGSNNFSGPLPSELGNWTKLEHLYIDSSGVSGEIPSTLAKLQNMAIVWASDTELTGRIPDFIGNWSKLSTLRFQGNSFDGPIPSSFSNLNLTDLRISGLSNGSSTLAFMKNMKSLSFLELRNNNISDSIPSNIGEFQSLQHLDLSFNNLGGDIPDSLFNLSSLANLFLGNNKLNGTLPAQKSTSLLNIDVSYNNLNGSLPSWINQQNLQLNAVANNLRIDNSNSSLSSALSFGLNCLQRNFPCNRGAGIYYNFSIKAGGPQITSSNGLENGDYNVTLQFAEMAISDTSLRRSVGRRVFDIYIQGNRVLMDFDIKKEAGGISERAVQKQFRAQVSENYLEIHLFWAGKGTCCIPALGTYGPSISAISATPSINPPANPKKNRRGLIVGNVVGIGLVSFLSVITILWIVRRRKRPSDDDEVLLGIDVKPYTFSYSVLKTATKDFSPANKLGEGGFGPVYKGKLSDGRAIAVKQLSVASRQGKSQFVAEIVAISAVQHRNLVKLYGCCTEGSERLLVYEYLENSSLDQALFGERSMNFNWSTRYDICLGVARDFGLAKLYDDKKTHISTRVAGTFGYLSPEYAMRGHLTEKTDVFAFGVVALEVVSGRPNSDSSLDREQVYLLEWVWHLHENDREAELVDSRLPEFNEEEVKRIIGVALLCTQTLPSLRPPMSRVVAMLSGDMEVSTLTTKPVYLTDWKYDDTTTTSSFTSSDKATKGAETQHSVETDTEPILYKNL